MRGFTYLEDQSWIDREMTRGDDLPISLAQAKKVTQWLKRNWGDKIEATCKGTSFPPHVICAIACQETAYFWLKMSEQLSADEVLARCVLDASGETASDPRSAFPRNTGAFRSKYGDNFTDMLIDEANVTRKIRGLSPREWVYKGYGIFQYDLQAVTDDEAFFHKKEWYQIDKCLDRVMMELKSKWARTHELWASVKAYNGSGSRAEQYKRNVQRFADVTQDAWKEAPGPAPKPAPQPAPAAPQVAQPAAQPAPPQAAAPAPSEQPAAAPEVPVATAPAPTPSPAQEAQPAAQPAPAQAPVAPPATPPAPASAAVASGAASPAVAAALAGMVQGTEPKPAADAKPDAKPPAA